MKTHGQKTALAHLFSLNKSKHCNMVEIEICGWSSYNGHNDIYFLIWHLSSWNEIMIHLQYFGYDEFDEYVTKYDE